MIVRYFFSSQISAILSRPPILKSLWLSINGLRGYKSESLLILRLFVIWWISEENRSACGKAQSLILAPRIPGAVTFEKHGFDLCSVGTWNRCARRVICATARAALCHFENRANLLVPRLCSQSVLAVRTSGSTGRGPDGSFGSRSVLWYNTFGPFDHSDSVSLSHANDLVPRSAGLWSVSRWDHWLVPVTFRILAIRLVTYT